MLERRFNLLGRLAFPTFKRNCQSGKKEMALEKALALSNKFRDDYLLNRYIGGPPVRLFDEIDNLQFMHKAISRGWRGEYCDGRIMALVAYSYQTVAFAQHWHLQEAEKLIDEFVSALPQLRERNGYKQGRFYLTFGLILAALHHALRVRNYERGKKFLDFFREQLHAYLLNSSPNRSWQMFTQPIGMMAFDSLITGAAERSGDSRVNSDKCPDNYEKFFLEALRATAKDHFGEKRRTMRYALAFFGTPQDKDMTLHAPNSEYFKFIASSAFFRVVPDHDLLNSLDCFIKSHADLRKSD